MSDNATIGKCRSGHAWILEDQGQNCPHCQGSWTTCKYTTRQAIAGQQRSRELDGGASFNVQTFKPYTEDGFNGDDIRVESKGQRDALCRKHHVTYDDCSGIKPPEVAPAIDSIDFGDVKHALEHGIDEDATELDLPEVDEECLDTEAI